MKVDIIIRVIKVETKFDCIIVGAGVSGMTAALYLKRYGYDVMLLEKEVPGGQINQSPNIENYPGFTKIDGPSLALNLLEQLKSLGLRPTYGTVTRIDKEINKFIVVTDVASYCAKTIIIATGRKPKKLGISNEEKLIGHGISYCATCDGPLFKGKDVCVIGGGNSALEESLYLSNLCKKVTIIHRKSEFTADYTLIEKVKKVTNIDIKYNSVVSTFNEEEGILTGITLTDATKIGCEGVFIYIGLENDVEFLQHLDINKEGNSLIVENDMRTNIEGMFACGDAIKKGVYQIVTATSDGAIAATSVKKYLQTKG